MTDAALSRPELPRVFGRYLLLRQLSRGGMGEVLVARSGQLSGFEKLCVVKKILPHLAEDEDFIHRFIDEAQVAIRLAHANIAQVFEVGRAEGEYFLALEHVAGRDLRRLQARLGELKQRLPVDLALFVAREIASGLAYAHRKVDDDGRPLHVVHCDISPPNVVVSFEGEVKIIDFGIAKSARRITATNPKVGFGKFGYMAPEQLVRGGVVDRRTDIYACGVLLYELLVGERMFQFPEGTEYRDMARAVASGKHSLPSSKDPSLADLDPLVARAVAAQAANRFQSAEELRDGLTLELARRNPTLTGDRLGVYLRQLFIDEAVEEQQHRQQASALDLSAWERELAGPQAETVSYALADGPTAALTRAVVPEPSLPQAVDPLPIRRRTWILAGVTVASLSALVVLVLTRGDGGDAGAPMLALPPVIDVQALATGVAAPLLELAPPPHVRPLGVRAAAPDADAQTADTRADAAPRTGGPTEPIVASASEGAVTREAIKAKFSAVSGEYAAFRTSFGDRLGDDWAEILESFTYATGGARLDAFDAQLDALRQQMAAVRKNQGG